MITRRRLLLITAIAAAGVGISIPRAAITAAAQSTQGRHRVVGDHSTVRAWCAADAPLVVCLRRGTTRQVIDRLVTDDGVAWLAIAGQDGTLIGWAQALGWRVRHS